MMLVTVLAFASLGLGCGKSIGDACTVSVDCSTRGDRQCDLSLPGGYCTQLACRPNGCASEASCVLFGAGVPGCSVNEREVSRSARSQCMFRCEEDGDCRDGYRCAALGTAPLEARILDDNTNFRVCLPRTPATAIAATASSSPAALVCAEPTPSAVPTLKAPTPDAGGAGDAGSLDAAPRADASSTADAGL
jgi:hypothetical protein